MASSRQTVTPTQPKPPASVRLRHLWPDIRELVYPTARCCWRFPVDAGQPLGGFSPACFHQVPDRRCHREEPERPARSPCLSAVVGATLLQGVTSFALTQLLSKAAQRVIAELRRKVQAHIGRLPLGFYDSNKTGTLVSRIMTDVEGIRNLIGTGLVDFIGGLLTALLSLIVLFRISALMTCLTLAFIIVFALALQKSLCLHTADLPRTGKDHAM